MSFATDVIHNNAITGIVDMNQAERLRSEYDQNGPSGSVSCGLRPMLWLPSRSCLSAHEVNDTAVIAHWKIL